jgi:hypothetical protein
MQVTRRAAVSVLLSAVLLVFAHPYVAVAKGGGGRGSRGSAGSNYVRPHTTRDGAYVPGHRRTNPDASKLNNWSTKGNVNPHTGKPGTKNP